MTSGIGIRLMEGHHTPPQWELRSHGGPKAKPLIMLRKLTGYSQWLYPLARTTIIALGLLTIVIQWDG